ncbi:hypothetical protein M408DRAFT_24593 [Serendipita vermifera MAFF 305830]|uniref:F-box domain-containing protein n=1 Tax=Serendipita vermifera MAFF 305830 TaxID=933852 RepID=A0A0C3B7A8_SERVB|nr:hypothetical protein M408DRAFT_24593 [Serendipita vermifera MAFF 305830]
MERLPPNNDNDATHLSLDRHPIQGCSDEILQLIFEGITFSAVRPFSTAVSLSHVCRRWRSLALSTPSLWRTVMFKIQIPLQDLTPMIEAFATRIKYVPAEVFIDIEAFWEPKETIKSALAAIPFEKIYKISAISHLNIQIVADSLDKVLFSDVFDPIIYQRVDTFTLDLTIDRILSFNPFLENVPRVENLCLTEGRIGTSISPKFYTAGQKVTQLQLDNVQEVPLMALLRMTPILKTLTILRCELNAEENADVCTLPHLTSIHIGSYGFMWNKIRCPALTHLNTPSEHNRLEKDCFWTFLSSTPTITNVCAYAFHGPEYLRRLLGSCPQLLSLEASQSSQPMQTLTNGADSPGEALCPNLRKLVIKIDRGQYVTEEVNFFLQARCFPEQDSQSVIGPRVKHSLKDFEIHISGRAVHDANTSLLERHFTLTERRPASGWFKYQLTSK